MGLPYQHSLHGIRVRLNNMHIRIHIPLLVYVVIAPQEPAAVGCVTLLELATQAHLDR